MKIFPSASGRTIWVRDTGAHPVERVTAHALLSGYVKRSQSVRLVNSRQDDKGVRWYEFKLQKVSS